MVAGVRKEYEVYSEVVEMDVVAEMVQVQIQNSVTWVVNGRSAVVWVVYELEGRKVMAALAE